MYKLDDKLTAVPNFSILVNSCDRYDDLWLPFFTLLEKYWPDHPAVFLSTETKKAEFENVVTINCPNATTWGERFKNAVSSIKTDYVLVLLDDFFLRKPVKTDKINDSLYYLHNNKNASVFYYLGTGPLFRKQFKDDEKYKDFELANKNARYKLNLQAALWRKDDLVSYINYFDTPRTWEVLGSKYVKSNKDFYFTKPGVEAVFDYGHNWGIWGVYRGQWVKNDVVPLFDKEKINVDFSKREFYRPDKKLNIIKSKIDVKIKLFKCEYKYYKKLK